MNIQKIRHAEDAAKRFLQAVDDLDDRASRDPEMRRFIGIVGFKETAAVRRASMDLTRALADLRKPA